MVRNWAWPRKSVPGRKPYQGNDDNRRVHSDSRETKNVRRVDSDDREKDRPDYRDKEYEADGEDREEDIEGTED